MGAVVHRLASCEAQVSDLDVDASDGSIGLLLKARHEEVPRGEVAVNKALRGDLGHALARLPEHFDRDLQVQ